MPGRLRPLFFAVCLFAFVRGGVCAAATPASSMDLIQAYRGNVQFHRVADASFRAFEAHLSTHCAEITEDWDDATFIFAGDPVADSTGKLQRIAWEERVPGVACGRQRLYRVRVSVVDGRGSVKPMLPGDGLSSPDLPEAEGAVQTAVRTLQGTGTCAVDVVDTRLKAEGMVDSREPWTEVWTVNACGRQIQVPVQFTPQPQKGTDIDILVAGITYKQDERP